MGVQLTERVNGQDSVIAEGKKEEMTIYLDGSPYGI